MWLFEDIKSVLLTSFVGSAINLTTTTTFHVVHSMQNLKHGNSLVHPWFINGEFEEVDLVVFWCRNWLKQTSLFNSEPPKTFKMGFLVQNLMQKIGSLQCGPF